MGYFLVAKLGQLSPPLVIFQNQLRSDQKWLGDLRQGSSRQTQRRSEDIQTLRTIRQQVKILLFRGTAAVLIKVFQRTRTVQVFNANYIFTPATGKHDDKMKANAVPGEAFHEIGY